MYSLITLEIYAFDTGASFLLMITNFALGLELQIITRTECSSGVIVIILVLLSLRGLN